MNDARYIGRTRLVREVAGVLFVPSILFMHEFRNAEEPGADFQASAFCGKPVDLKMNLVCFDRQIDDPALDSESVGFTNRQST